jgi:hypothetical protein
MVPRPDRRNFDASGVGDPPTPGRCSYTVDELPASAGGQQVVKAVFGKIHYTNEQVRQLRLRRSGSLGEMMMTATFDDVPGGTKIAPAP